MVMNGRLDSSFLTFICARLKFQNCLNVTSATVELPCNISRLLRQLQNNENLSAFGQNHIIEWIYGVKFWCYK